MTPPRKQPLSAGTPTLSRRSVLIGAGVAASVALVGIDLTNKAAPASAWGGYSNGQIPLSELTQVGGYYFRNDAAQALVALRAAYASALGRTLIINDGYRDLAGQQQAWNDYQNGGNLAAPPGTSNHGWAIAADFGGEVYSSSSSAGHQWLQANAQAYGWWWAGRTFNQIENWHWEYNGTYSGDSAKSVRAVKELAVHSGSWQAIPVGQDQSSAFSAVDMGGGWGQLYGSINGHLQVVCVANGAWTRMDSGLALDASSLVALNVGQGWPQLLAVENGTIYHVYADSAGWHKMSTGLKTPGKISAVRLPSGEIEAFTNINGVLYVINSHSGWEMGNSGTPIGDNFKAVLVNGSPQIVTNINGIIHIIWPGAGWQLQSTGQPTSGSITAVSMGGGYPTIISNEGWSVTVTSVINGAWTRQAMGVSTSGNVDALNLGGAYPVIYVV